MVLYGTLWGTILQVLWSAITVIVNNRRNKIKHSFSYQVAILCSSSQFKAVKIKWQRFSDSTDTAANQARLVLSTKQCALMRFKAIKLHGLQVLLLCSYYDCLGAKEHCFCCYTVILSKGTRHSCWALCLKDIAIMQLSYVINNIQWTLFRRISLTKHCSVISIIIQLCFFCIKQIFELYALTYFMSKIFGGLKLCWQLIFGCCFVPPPCERYATWPKLQQVAAWTLQ